MLSYLTQHKEIVADFVAALIPHCRHGFGANITTIGVLDEQGRLIAGLIYHNYDEPAGIIEISGAAVSRRWLTRDSIARMFRYPFLQLGCQMVVMRTPADNEHLLGLLASYGFAFTKLPRLYGRDRDGVICTLTAEDWAANRFNKRLKHHLHDAELQEAA